MTVAALPAVVEYAEDGVSTSFAVPYRFKSPTDLIVERVINGVVFALGLGVDYNATGGATDAGGTVTRVVATNGATLRIRRNTARAQSMRYPTGGRFPAESHEEALDRLTLIAQEQDAGQEDTNARALLLPPGEVAAGLPARADRVGGTKKVLAVNQATGDIVVEPIGDAYRGDPGKADNTYTSFAAMQASDPTRASARLVGDTDVPPHADGPYNNPTQTLGGWVPQGAAGIVTQAPGSPAILTQAQKNAQIVHIDDYGGRPNTPSYDNAEAYNRAADALGERGGTIRYGAGTYFGKNLYARQFVTLLGAGRAPGVALANASHTILQALPGTGALIDEHPSTPGFCFSVQCLSLKGDGVSGDCIGVKLGLQADGFTPLNVQYFIKDVDLDNFAHQAILIGGLNPIVDNVKATNSLLKRNRPGFEGVIHSFANDGNFTRIEPNSGLTQAEVRAALNGDFDLLKVVALVDRGANNFLSHIQPAYSGMGIYCSSPTSRFTNSRTDRNFGHGWAGTGMIDSETCFSYNNSLAGTGLYDGFNSFGMPSGTGTPFAVSDGSVNDINGAIARHRYGINLSASGFANLQQKVRVELPFYGSRGHATAAFLDHPSEPNIGRVSHGVSAVPNIEQATAWIADDFGATAITDLPPGYVNQEVVIPGPAQIVDGSIILLAGTTIAYDYGAVTLKYLDIAGTGKRWVQVSGIDYGIGDAAKMNSVSRPTPGKRFFRSDLNKFVYRNGANTGWADGAGVAV